MKTEINHFDDLLHAARAQRERQRLLLVFAGTELPEGATPGQRERFAQGDGGVVAHRVVDPGADRLAIPHRRRHHPKQRRPGGEVRGAVHRVQHEGEAIAIQ